MDPHDDSLPEAAPRTLPVTTPEPAPLPGPVAPSRLSPRWYAAYIALGFVATCVSHVAIWHAGVVELFQFWTYSPWVYLPLGLVLALAVYAAALRLLQLGSARAFVTWSLVLVWVPAVVSYLLAASASKLVFEPAITLVGLAAYALANPLGAARTAPVASLGGVEAWRALSTVAKTCFGLITLLAGALATAILSRFEADKETQAKEILRILALMAYLVFGMTTLLLAPLFTRALEARPAATRHMTSESIVAWPSAP